MNRAGPGLVSKAEPHHAHGPANRGRIVLTTAAPLFVCEPIVEHPLEAVIALHGPRGITSEFEDGLRAMAARGYLVAAPFHYFRNGGPEYVNADAAILAYEALTEFDIDVDIDAAIDHVETRLGLRPVAVIGAAPAAAGAARRAAGRHPTLAADMSSGDAWESTLSSNDKKGTSTYDLDANVDSGPV
jgi:carboxymethylenebutenolidase